MKKLLLPALFTVLFLSFTHGQDKKETTTIKVDISNPKSINVNDYNKNKIVFTKDATPFFLKSITDIFTTSDGYIISDLQSVIKFDFNGKFIQQITCQGRAANEYVSGLTTKLWTKNDSLFLYDMLNKRVLIFNNKNVLVDTKPTPKDEMNSFSDIYPYNNGYIGLKEYTSSTPTPKFALYNSDFQFIRDFTNEKIKNFFDFLSDLYNSPVKNELLYVRPLENNVYAIHQSGDISKKYVVDFMKYSIPQNFISKNDRERMTFMKENENNYVWEIKKICESDNYLCFTYPYNMKHNFVIHDKKNDRTKVFIIPDANGYSVQNIFFDKDMILCYLESENEVALLKIKIKELISRS